MPSSSVDAFKTAFRTHPAGVAVITAGTPEGPIGLTASSVASVGIDPLALSFSVTRSSGSAGGILRADTYLVHLVSDREVGIAQAFAVSGSDRFTPEQGWETLETGEPHLPSARVALRCRSLSIVPVGTSSLVLAEVLDVIEGPEGQPVVYADRTFRPLASAA